MSQLKEIFLFNFCRSNLYSIHIGRDRLDSTLFKTSNSINRWIFKRNRCQLSKNYVKVQIICKKTELNRNGEWPRSILIKHVNKKHNTSREKTLSQRENFRLICVWSNRIGKLKDFQIELKIDPTIKQVMIVFSRVERCRESKLNKHQAHKIDSVICNSIFDLDNICLGF